jgi:hypothetical protein
MKRVSWRDEAVKRLDDACGLNPAALGIVDGVVPKIDRSPVSFWKNSAQDYAKASSAESKEIT